MEMLFNGDGEQGSRVCRVHIGEDREVNYQVRERNGSDDVGEQL